MEVQRKEYWNHAQNRSTVRKGDKCVALKHWRINLLKDIKDNFATSNTIQLKAAVSDATLTSSC